MKTVYPDYYKDFKCIADKCRHSCCIGWEIDIDKESLDFYNSVKGDFGKKLQDNISLEGTPHFILSERERCPFLNRRNLCDIYTTLGKNCLCQICSDHPRFYNELPDRIEAGLGLCCEEAARLIITKKEPVKLLGEDKIGENGIILARGKIFKILQDRSISVAYRIEKVLSLTGTDNIDLDITKWVKLFESLERLDEDWSTLLSKLKANYKTADIKGFDAFMKDRETEYEQLLCYLIYRHFSMAEFIEDMAVYSAFAALSFNLIYALGAVIFTEKCDFTVADQLELIRLFSSEIEYSDQNLDIIFCKLQGEIFDYCN